MTLVHLARHGTHVEVGHVLSGRSEIGLSERGRHEAAWLAERLAAHRLTAVWSSPRRRTVETAGIIAARHTLPVATDAGLDEIDFGRWAGMAFDALATDPDWRQWNEARGSATAPDGESMADVLARAIPVVERLGQLDGEVLAVTHCDVIRAIVAHYLGLSQDRLQSFDCDPASLTTLAIEPWGGRVVSVNERPR